MSRDEEYEVVRPVVSAVLKLTFDLFMNLAGTGLFFAEWEQQVVVSLERYRYGCRRETVRFTPATSLGDVNRSGKNV
jgi:hypothetical protein